MEEEFEKTLRTRQIWLESRKEARSEISKVILDPVPLVMTEHHVLDMNSYSLDVIELLEHQSLILQEC